VIDYFVDEVDLTNVFDINIIVKLQNGLLAGLRAYLYDKEALCYAFQSNCSDC